MSGNCVPYQTQGGHIYPSGAPKRPTPFAGSNSSINSEIILSTNNNLNFKNFTINSEPILKKNSNNNYEESDNESLSNKLNSNLNLTLQQQQQQPPTSSEQQHHSIACSTIEMMKAVHQGYHNSLPPKSHLKNTKMCKHFQQGYCMLGDSCNFAHSWDDMVQARANGIILPLKSNSHNSIYSNNNITDNEHLVNVQDNNLSPSTAAVVMNINNTKSINASSNFDLTSNIGQNTAAPINYNDDSPLFLLPNDILSGPVNIYTDEDDRKIAIELIKLENERLKLALLENNNFLHNMAEGVDTKEAKAMRSWLSNQRSVILSTLSSYTKPTQWMVLAAQLKMLFEPDVSALLTKPEAHGPRDRTNAPPCKPRPLIGGGLFTIEPAELLSNLALDVEMAPKQGEVEKQFNDHQSMNESPFNNNKEY